MKLSKKAEYALKALIELTISYDKGIATLINDIADRENIPPRYLEQILLILKNNGILQSKRGVGGGYSLNRPPENISLAEVLRIVDGHISSLNEPENDIYRSMNDVSCGLQSIMREVSSAIINIVGNISLKDMAKRTLTLIEEKKNVLNYAI